MTARLTHHWLLLAAATTGAALLWTEAVIASSRTYVLFNRDDSTSFLGQHVEWKLYALVTITGVALAVHLLRNWAPKLTLIGGSLAVGGGLANLAGMQIYGGVPDFLHSFHGQYASPGDLALFVGVALLILGAVFACIYRVVCVFDDWRVAASERRSSLS